MNSIAEFVAVLPCRSGCTRTEDDHEVPLPGIHGGYCARCFGLAAAALGQAAPLVYHLLHQVGGLRSKPSSGGEQHTKASSAPLPMNVRAFDDANEVHRILVNWTTRFSTLLDAPVPNVDAWRTVGGVVRGISHGVSPEYAREQTARIATWLSLRLEDIAKAAEVDEFGRFRADLGRIRRANLRWPTEDKPKFSRSMICPDDGERILLVPPREPQADQGIVCSSCGRQFTEDEHEQYSRYLRAVARESRKRQAERVQDVVARRAA